MGHCDHSQRPGVRMVSDQMMVGAGGSFGAELERLCTSMLCKISRSDLLLRVHGSFDLPCNWTIWDN